MFKKGVLLALALVLLSTVYSTKLECFPSQSCDCDGFLDAGETKYECLDALSASERLFCEESHILDVIYVAETHKFDTPDDEELTLVSYDSNSRTGVFSWKSLGVDTRKTLNPGQTDQFPRSKELLALDIGPVPWQRNANAILFCAKVNPYCGNNYCESGEHFNEQFCAADCPRPPGICYENNICESDFGETVENCAADCTPRDFVECREDKSCFESRFATCSRANFTEGITDFLGFGSVEYYVEIIGAENNRCKMKSKYTKNINPEYVGKEMICSYDNSKSFDEAEKEIIESFNTEPHIGGCAGPLYNLLTGTPAQAGICNENLVCEEKNGETMTNCEKDCRQTQSDLDFCTRSEIQGNFREGTTKKEKIGSKTYELFVKQVDAIRGTVKVTFDAQSATIERNKIQQFRNNIQAIVSRVTLTDTDKKAHICVDVEGVGVILPPTQTHSILVQITDGQDKSIVDASVALEGITKTTNSQGSVVFEQKTSGNYTIRITKQGYLEKQVPVEVTSKDEDLRIILVSSTITPPRLEDVSVSYKLLVGKQSDPSDLFTAQKLKNSGLQFTTDPDTNEVILKITKNPPRIETNLVFDEDVQIIQPGANYVLIGGPCGNTQASQLLSNPIPCTKGFSADQARIELYSIGENTVVLIAGQSKEDTELGVKALINYAGIDLTGKKFIASKDAFGEVFLMKIN